MNSEVVATRVLGLLFVAWFVSGGIIGFFLNNILGLPPLAGSIFYWADPFLNNFSLYCWAWLSHISLVPVALYIAWRYGFAKCRVASSARLALFSIVVVCGCISFGLIRFDGNNIFSKFVEHLVAALDWLGLAFIVFVSTYTLVLALVVTLKGRE